MSYANYEDWNVDASIDDLLTEFDGFHPALLEAWKSVSHILPYCSALWCGVILEYSLIAWLHRKADDLKLWKLLARKPIPRWYNGKAVLIGDAAHPMLPCKLQARHH